MVGKGDAGMRAHRFTGVGGAVEETGWFAFRQTGGVRYLEIPEVTILKADSSRALDTGGSYEAIESVRYLHSS